MIAFPTEFDTQSLKWNMLSDSKKCNTVSVRELGFYFNTYLRDFKRN